MREHVLGERLAPVVLASTVRKLLDHVTRAHLPIVVRVFGIRGHRGSDETRVQHRATQPVRSKVSASGGTTMPRSASQRTS